MELERGRSNGGGGGGGGVGGGACHEKRGVVAMGGSGRSGQRFRGFGANVGFRARVLEVSIQGSGRLSTSLHRSQ